MFSRQTKKESKLETIVGTGTEIEGDLRTTEGLRVDGRVKGSVHAESIVIGNQGHVMGDVITNKITISGKVKGNISAASLLELLPEGQIIGDIRTSKLIVADGAKFEGNCQMVKSDGQIIELNADSGAFKGENGANKNLKVVGESGKK